MSAADEDEDADETIAISPEDALTSIAALRIYLQALRENWSGARLQQTLFRKIGKRRLAEVLAHLDASLAGRQP